jgi:hypothetical protein
MISILTLLLSGLAAAPPAPIKALSDITKAIRYQFGVHDLQGHSLDCLQVVPLSPGAYLGVYHSVVDGKLRLHLGQSKDLFRWTAVITLDVDASQGTLFRTSTGSFLLSYEKSRPNSVWIRMRYYPSLQRLETGDYVRQFDIIRTLAPTAEGTPSFESVRMNGSLSRSVIRLRFHYFRNGDVDRGAIGTLRGFKEWSARPDEVLNHAMERMGAFGNIGDRETFTWNGRTFILQEGQGQRLDWKSWRVYLYDPTKAQAWYLPIRTPKGSVAFSNPSISAVTGPHGEPIYVVTLFLPGEGSQPGESGEAIYTIPRPE